MKLSTRLLLAMVLLVFLTSAAVATLSLYSLQSAILPAELSALGAHADQLAEQLDSSVREARTDVLALRSSAAVDGIVRAQQAGGVDPLSGVRLEDWEDQLAALFTGIVKAKKNYIQVRLIGVTNKGRELIRVNRVPNSDQVVVVPSDKLQQKGDRGYFQAASKVSPGKVYVSPIELNQEQGVIQTPHMPVLRTATPVYSPNHDLFGILIINVDLRPALADLQARAKAGGNVYLVNATGDYLSHPDPKQTFGFDLGQRKRLPDDFPELAEAIAKEKPLQATIQSKRGEMLAVAVSPRRLAGEIPVTIVETESYAVLLAAGRSVFKSSLFAGFVGLCGAGLLAVLLSRSLTRPLTQMTSAVQKFDGNSPMQLPKDAGGEIGLLAESFERMAKEVTEKNASLHEEIQERTQAEERIREAMRQRDEFLAMLSHELRNPMSTVRSAVELLSSNKPTPSEQDDALQAIQRQVEHMARLLDDLLDVSRVTRGKLRVQTEVLDLGIVTQHAIDAVRPLAEKNKIHLHYLAANKPVWVEGDRARLLQAEVNLLTNAIKYSPPDLPVEVSLSQDEKNASFRVRDQGIGVPPEFQESIFELFYQVDAKIDRSLGGMGVGLTLVRTIAELHGGKVSLRSEGEGKGSEFLLELPLVAPPVKSLPTAVDTEDAEQRRTLLVEDQEDARVMLRRVLEHEGHEVRAAVDGEEALGVVKSWWPEVAILDIGLPQMDGYELAGRLRELDRGHNLVLIALTGYGQPEDVQKAKDAGFDFHMVKPARLDELRRLIAMHERPPAPAS